VNEEKDVEVVVKEEVHEDWHEERKEAKGE
jgi:hypothetical protein